MNKEKDMAPYFFHQGTNFFAYKYLGCNLKIKNGKYEYCFRTWAPNADKVALVSDFTGWENPVYFNKITNKGVWECKYINDKSLSGSAYKFLIERDGRKYYKGDPYARFSRGGADGASIIFDDRFSFSDSVWMKRRKKEFASEYSHSLSKPINIYEIHFGSFMRREDNSY